MIIFVCVHVRRLIYIYLSQFSRVYYYTYTITLRLYVYLAQYHHFRWKEIKIFCYVPIYKHISAQPHSALFCAQRQPHRGIKKVKFSRFLIITACGRGGLLWVRYPRWLKDLLFLILWRNVSKMPESFSIFLTLRPGFKMTETFYLFLTLWLVYKMTETFYLFLTLSWYTRWQKPLLSFYSMVGVYTRCRKDLISFSFRNLISLSHPAVHLWQGYIRCR